MSNIIYKIPYRENLRSAGKALYSSNSISEALRNIWGNVINQTENGVVYDKKPFKIALKAGKKYYWCLCGRSKSQPFCDGSHLKNLLKITQKPIRPVRFHVDESKEYWLCTCKQTKNRPFCDGTHNSKLVQEASATIRQ